MSTASDTTPRWVRGRAGRSLRRLPGAPEPAGTVRDRLTGPAPTSTPDAELDTSSLAAALQDRLRTAAGTPGSAVWVRGAAEGDLRLVAEHGPQSRASEAAARRCLALGRASWRADVLSLPLRVRDEIFGAVTLGSIRLPDPGGVTALQDTVDDYAMGLDTALFIQHVRSSATSEERHRLAREIHDGVAQRIVALGYLADDVSVLAEGQEARQALASLRAQIEWVAGELRMLFMDLRDDSFADLDVGISAALETVLRELGRRSELRTHTRLDERGGRLPRETEREVLKIAQEAISNAHAHARAINLWVTLVSDGQRLRLLVEDDGVGRAVPRPGHFGLQGMRERAERIGAELAIDARPDGGTAVTLVIGATRPATTQGDDRVHQGSARR